MSAAPRNRLARQTSPYLLQHAGNPVDWYPWGAEALESAREADRPILLSIGYSACHWCHVMAHESFEDGETAELMNELFINIKVDREERPDLDRIYQLAHQLLTGRSGGWPLTMFLSPDDQRPFFGGTYFPRLPRAGMPPFQDVLRRVAAHYCDNGDEVREQNERLVAALARVEPPAPAAAVQLDVGPLHLARERLGELFDARHGGFGTAPKFPQPTNLEVLLRHHAARRDGPDGADREALAMVLYTLARMGNGGLYDQLGGGFYRYSTDAEWTIPHFEKMLYDNAALLALSVAAWQLSRHDDFRRWAAETADWVLREMQHPEGGYYSSLDADSEGDEGRFYVWQPEQLHAVLGASQAALVARRFGLDGPPNFEGRAWHLTVRARLDELGLPEAQARAAIDAARRRLLAEREQRVRPGRDEKVLTAWNALMIRAMAKAGMVLQRPELVDSALGALDFVRRHLWRDGRLLATCKDGRAHLMAYLDDHAFLIEAILACAEARWRDGDLVWAMDVAEVLVEQFSDEQRGGFFFTAADHEELIHRSRGTMDEALPSGNAVAARALARLGHLLGEQRYLDVAERTLYAGWEGLRRIPHAHGALLSVLEEWLMPVQTVVLRGTVEAMQPWAERARQHHAPCRQVLAIPPDARRLPGLLGERHADAGAAVMAYVCNGFQCEAPITDFEHYAQTLRERESGRSPERS